MTNFSLRYDENVHAVKTLLRVDESFDLLVKHQVIGGRRAVFFCIDGFIKDTMFEKMLEYLSNLTPQHLEDAKTADAFVARYVTYVEANTELSADTLVTAVLSGAIGMLMEGFDRAVVIDPRTYPSRSVEEPESDRLLRGAHDGFLETVIFNTALIRRRIRNPFLTMQLFQIGSRSKTDVVVCYLADTVRQKSLVAVQKRLREIDVAALPMSQESLRECLVPAQPWNPFPRFRYTERPDTAAACIYEGNVLILVDGSPAALIVPSSIFDFAQDINDYYFPPLVGSFLRNIRILVFVVSFLFTPLWYLLLLHRGAMPDWMQFIFVNEPNGVSVYFQLIVSEFMIDCLRLASLNTPNALSTSFSVIGALVLGEFGVQSGIFVPEVVLFMAFTAVANFAQPSFELGFSVKYARMVVLSLTALLDVWGYAAGMLVVLLVLCFTKTLEGYTYLSPLVPFDKAALKNVFHRRSINVRYRVQK
ncbi:MAG: spore germination protein [Clostridia bacterium]|nr:spore germination protein [Clostridia bacterium]